jgi:AcrR family transcriptional regulator
LADAALDLFADRGFDETTVEDIAAACEVSSRTFFRYFAAKEDVLWAEADEYLTRLVDAISIRPRDEQPLRALRCAAVSLADAYEEEVERVALRNQVVAATPSLRIRGMEQQTDWEEAIVAALSARGESEADWSPRHVRLVAGAGMVALRVAVDEWIADSRQSLAVLIGDVFDELALGLDPS